MQKLRASQSVLVSNRLLRVNLNSAFLHPYMHNNELLITNLSLYHSKHDKFPHLEIYLFYFSVNTHKQNRVRQVYRTEYKSTTLSPSSSSSSSDFLLTCRYRGHIHNS